MRRNLLWRDAVEDRLLADRIGHCDEMHIGTRSQLQEGARISPHGSAAIAALPPLRPNIDIITVQSHDQWKSQQLGNWRGCNRIRAKMGMQQAWPFLQQRARKARHAEVFSRLLHEKSRMAHSFSDEADIEFFQVQLLN